AFERRLDAPLVGRQDELTRLREAFALAVRERTLVAVSVLGQAGIGKSRLVLELRRAVEAEATVLEGRCLSYGEGMTLWPLRALVRAAAGGETRDEILAVVGAVEASEAVAERLAQALGSGSA